MSKLDEMYATLVNALYDPVTGKRTKDMRDGIRAVLKAHVEPLLIEAHDEGQHFAVASWAVNRDKAARYAARIIANLTAHRPLSPAMEKLKELEQRLVAATGADRELDLLIGKAFDGVDPRAVIVTAGNYTGAIGYTDRDQWAVVNLKSYTASLDAAVALCERLLPGWHWSVSDRGLARVSNPNANEFQDDRFDALGNAPALALCLAIVRALLAGKGEG